MDQMTMDLFDQPADDSPSTASQPILAREEANKLLERVIASSSRKSAYKALSQEERAQLAEAISVVSAHKRAAYDMAAAGAALSPSGWIVAQPELAIAIAVLNRHFIDDVPMAGSADAGV